MNLDDGRLELVALLDRAPRLLDVVLVKLVAADRSRNVVLLGELERALHVAAAHRRRPAHRDALGDDVGCWGGGDKRQQRKRVPRKKDAAPTHREELGAGRSDAG